MSYVYKQHEIPEGECTDPDPREATSEDIRSETFNVPQQISTCGSNTSEKETLNPEVLERLEKLEEECRNQKLLSQAMSMHNQSENVNDPFRLTAVLSMFRTLKLQEWGKCWSSSDRLSYSGAGNIIKKLFDACEKDIEKRKTVILEILGFSSSDNAANSCKQEQMLGIMKLLRDGYYHSDLGICEIIKQADVPLRSMNLKQFAQKCCRVFCLLLLQDSPVKVVWYMDMWPQHYLEYVDQQVVTYHKRNKVQILWPMLTDGQTVIEKGVVYDGM
ncbi:uncharacterized protein LOC417973 isoform X3 [Gallus gallus]|uniref:uncharacterized protein LOC417973 isoform X3 n=1 Tax=Gallus gallus TaxID=9031 RepID=UPI001AE8F957|nr:uncharacterized protein LOC417973 isoform X3 [Gallus gallus]